MALKYVCVINLFLLTHFETFPITDAGKCEVTWYKGNDVIRESEDFKYESIGEVHRLVIAEVFPEDSGPYRAVASNDTGTTTSYFTVFVNGRMKSPFY